MSYKGTETFQLLIKNYHATILIDKWLEQDVQTDLRVRRAKTGGHIVIETKDVLFANFVRESFPGCQVNIKE